MGCASSKEKRCRHCNAPYSPVPRSYSMHVHHPPQSKDDSHHLVGLTSSTFGSLKLDLSHKAFDNSHQNGIGFSNGGLLEKETNIKEFSKELTEAKTWSNSIDQKISQVIPRTPVETPPGEPETINTWELMEGLEDMSPLRSPNHFRSFSFDVHSHPIPAPAREHKPMYMWLQRTEDEPSLKSNVPDFDPEAISSFRKSSQQLSPDIPFHRRTLDRKNLSYDFTEETKINGDVIDFEPLSCGKDRVVVYFTSLRGIRKTYEDCSHVRVILKGLGVRVDERDVSMHSGFKEELKELLGDKIYRGGLPRVFVGNNYIGGVEEIRKLHEDGHLEKLLDRCEKINDGEGVCEGCGDIRFVLCETCSGSCKIYYEGDEEEEDGEVAGYGFQRCPDCNENGLIRCPICF
ncbi:uncharacterized protein At3g28850-like [Neltuma alba]|uniref:uncharacterized protein At3g28850-like n=1 Tax=Neltuma alba TaxID=207710 RepID=UPI0010A34CC4|nr:uncharacterized protein At3g28850-like [Prosopis alba]